MFLDPNHLDNYAPAEILQAASQGHIGLDRRFLRALIQGGEKAQQAALEFAKRDRSRDLIDLAPELVALFSVWKLAEAVPFLMEYVKEDPSTIPDEAMEALVRVGAPALEPLLELYRELDESDSGDLAFILASLGVRDQRILELLLDRMEFDMGDTVLLLSVYGDPAALPALEKAEGLLGDDEEELKKEIADAREAITAGPDGETSETEDDALDVWSLYAEETDLPVDLLDEDARLELLQHPIELVRESAAHSFFNNQLGQELRSRLLSVAQNDTSAAVRARAWESLITATEETEVVEAMLTALRNQELPLAEREGLVVGLSSETDRNEVRAAINELYKQPGSRAKALEAMWRSMHPSFRDAFARHLDDGDLEVRRSAIWGVGYYGVRSELERIRGFFGDEELRADALFAYALATPAEVSPGRMRGLLSRIEKDAHGLSEMEEDLVKAALDERLMLAGKEPFFAREED